MQYCRHEVKPLHVGVTSHNIAQTTTIRATRIACNYYISRGYHLRPLYKLNGGSNPANERHPTLVGNHYIVILRSILRQEQRIECSGVNIIMFCEMVPRINHTCAHGLPGPCAPKL